MQNEDKHRYDDMLDLPHPVSAKHPHMSLLDRAAQFAPFAALTGYHAAIDETGRYTESFEEPDDLRQAQLNETLLLLQSTSDTHPRIQITFFVPDTRKEGGRWKTVSDKLHSVDAERQILALSDGTEIDFFRISEIRIESLEGDFT